MRTESGQLLRNSLKIYNLGARPQQFTIKTVDWLFSEAGEISFQEPLAEDSCREWVRLERHRINVVPDPQRPRNCRFEIQVPEGAPAPECRFAIMIESHEGDYAARFASGTVNMPISAITVHSTIKVMPGTSQRPHTLVKRYQSNSQLGCPLKQTDPTNDVSCGSIVVFVISRMNSANNASSVIAII